MYFIQISILWEQKRNDFLVAHSAILIDVQIHLPNIFFFKNTICTKQFLFSVIIRSKYSTYGKKAKLPQNKSKNKQKDLLYFCFRKFWNIIRVRPFGLHKNKNSDFYFLILDTTKYRFVFFNRYFHIFFFIV